MNVQENSSSISRSTSSDSSKAGDETITTPHPHIPIQPDLISNIARYLLDTILFNKKHRHTHPEAAPDIFSSKTIPNLTLEEFLIRFIKYSKIENSTLVSAFYYLKTFLEKQRYILAWSNVFNIWLVVCVLSIKFNEDSRFKNSYYGKIRGITLEKFNWYEYHMFVLIKDDLMISAEIFKQTWNYLHKNSA